MRNTLCLLSVVAFSLAAGCAAPTAEEQIDATESELSAAKCRVKSNANRLDCRLEGTVERTYRDADACIVYLRAKRTGILYGLVEDSNCTYTKAFEGKTPAVGTVWTRFADTSALEGSTVAALRDTGKDPTASARTFYMLNGELHGALPPVSGLKAAIENAITPLGGAEASLTKKITLSKAPAALKAALSGAVSEIDNRSFEGTDYSAEVEGIYAVYDSPAKTNIVAYVVYGTGSGEPDYHDGIIIGFDLEGTRVYEESDSG